jgi:hypothetical protein
MTVVVDENFIADPLSFNHKALRTEGAKADDLTDDPVARDTNGGKLSSRRLSKGTKAGHVCSQSKSGRGESGAKE